ncbi:hypothetical protein CLV45_1257 [Hymenobacter chitinivorans DSM 11115]|uniref:Uncharacterized protein n=2 Tax=Hymenobacter chitinivorans TaxID=89969 RepID=A0A2M9BPF0_9BACT|nr:hypothetical protein CLV45_1257 [Hymenobacter chitinivorans DSM 11115]
MKQLQEYAGAKLTEWDAQNGITSLNEYYAELNAEEREDGTVDFLISQEKLLGVPDEKFASILNTDGVFQVGDEIHKINQHEELIFPAEREDILLKGNWDDPDIKHFPIDYKYVAEDGGGKDVGGKIAKQQGQTITAQRTGNFYGWYEQHQYTDVNGRTLPKTWNDRDTRLVAVQWNVTYYFYASHGVRTKYEYKSRFAGWLWNDASNLAVDGTSSVRRSGSPAFTVGGSSSDTNSSSTSSNLVWIGGRGVSISIVSSVSHHSTIYKGATARLTL